MAKLSFPLGLVAVLISTILPTVSGITLNEVFIVHSGGSNGGCDQYFNQVDGSGTLDEWLEEINFSLSAAINAIDEYQNDPKVRKALNTFFGITSKNKKPAAGTQKVIDDIGENLRLVLDFFEAGPDGNPRFPLNGDRYLFCGSNFLVEQSPDAAALDWQAKNILDSDNDVVPINKVPIYADALAQDKANKIWWSGDRTPINGYYFSPTDGDYCDVLSGPNKDIKNLGLTAEITELEVDSNGQAMRRRSIESVVFCPETFTNGKPDTFGAANASIAEETNLADVVPKSATLMHEAFHVVFGAGPTGFLEGDEIYDLIDYIDKAKRNAVQKARQNPENYVFFVAHMFHLYGQPDEGINANWDFKVSTKPDGNKVYGAITPA
ncbi:hypothetical protein V8C42DRAFT_358930 [Trichoderma barbatum]